MKLVAVLILGMSMVACGGGTGGGLQEIPIGAACSVDGQSISSSEYCPNRDEGCGCARTYPLTSVCIQPSGSHGEWICAIN